MIYSTRLWMTELENAPTFIETQFPVAKLSMESYKERKAGASQTLTGLGKWWGRKPLVLVRAALLGLLLPATDEPQKDMDVFLRLMTMDDEGLRRRKNKTIPAARLAEELLTMPPSVQRRFLELTDRRPPTVDRPALRRLSREEREELQWLVFDRLPYGEKLNYCARPEQIDGPSPEVWAVINAHLGSDASSLPDLVEELGVRRFGQRPRVGDAFCGGGSVPFEAARLGCDAYGSDLNPVAALLTWAALNIVGGGEGVAEQVREAQERIFAAVDRQITEWGIEHNSLGWRADAYLYCVEVVDPESGWRVPLAPSWQIAQKYNVMARPVPDPANKRYDIEIVENASAAEMKAAKNGTVNNSRLVPPDGGPSTPIEVVRRGLRLWENGDVVPRPDDVFQERLYCIRWVETYIDEKGVERTRRHYRAPTAEDHAREAHVLELLRQRFDDWQTRGYISSRRIEPGYNTDQPIRERGWTHWHHLFTPRQLLMHGLLNRTVDELAKGNRILAAAGVLGVGICCNWNSSLCIWNSDSSKGPGNTEQTFANQALNTQFNYGGRGLTNLESSFLKSLPVAKIETLTSALPSDARQTHKQCHIWITDPPYADAVNYEEISEFFLCWYEGLLGTFFPEWSSDTKRTVAVKGNDDSFRSSLTDCYRQLAAHMPDDGLQIVMFTHQDAGVWSDLTMILWAAGLRVSAAWTIATETSSGLKSGNYVQGTVLLILRKREEDAAPVFLDEILPRVESEVRRQLDTMTRLDDASDPNFGDADYQLAAYAAALRVLTAQPIEEIDPAREIARERKPGEVGPVEALIRQAVAIACDHLVPHGVDAILWKRLSPMERFYLKGLEVESHGEYRNGVYQELARGFGAAAYTELLAGTQANETRLKSASEFGRRGLGGENFGGTLLRHVLYATHLAGQEEGVQAGLNWLKTELPDYWSQRERIIALLDYLAGLGRVSTMPQWQLDGRAAGLLAGAVRNDHL
jgi:putative DNA methylase